MIQEMNWMRAGAAALAICGAAALVSCEGGGSSSSSGASSAASGAATVSGNIVTFFGQTAALDTGRAPGWAQAVALLSDLLVSRAEAALPSVDVSVVGTGIRTSADARGNFVLSGVPSGRQEIIFSGGANSGVLVIDIPGGTTLDLVDVQVTTTQVSVADIVEVIVVSSASSGAGASGTTAAGQSGSDGNSANSNDTQSSDGQSQSRGAAGSGDQGSNDADQSQGSN